MTAPTAPAPGAAAVPAPAKAPTPFLIWIFTRLLVPTGPILIQYSLYGLDLYTPKFPQATFITMLFSLSLATLTELKDQRAVIYSCVIPSIVASVLYTAYVLNEHDAVKNATTLRVGFYFWAVLMGINILRVSAEIVTRIIRGQRP